MGIYRVITSLRCPCEVCAGELLEEASVEEFSNAEEAIEEFLRSGLDNEQGGVESSCWPWQKGSWFSRTGEDWNFQNPCDERTAKEISLHLPPLSEKYERKIAKRLGVIR